MTGPEHYKAAEETLRSAEMALGMFEDGYDGKRAMADSLTAQAQAHATLAHAAATAVAAAARLDAHREACAAEFADWMEATQP